LLVAGVVLLTGDALAQIDVINHRQWSWVMQRHRELQTELQGLSAERRSKVAEALNQCEEAVPLLTFARAMAIAKQVPADAHFRFRAGLQVLAMPEVVSKEALDHLAVTVYAPHNNLTGRLLMPKQFGFVVKVCNAKGEKVWEGKIDPSDEIRALREFRVTCKVPVAALPDGDYRVFLDTILDGSPAREHDLALSAAFSVRQDYKKRSGYFRSEAKSPSVADDLLKVEPLPRAILRGVAEYAARPYFGIPGIDPARSAADLDRAESILENLRSKKSALAGLTGYVDIALPSKGKDIVFVTLRLPERELPAPGSARWQGLAQRPLVLFVGRRPTWDSKRRRPSYPAFALPTYLAASLRLAKFDQAGGFQVVVAESPGRVAASQLQAMLAHLSKVVPYDPKRLVLVGEGQGASAAVGLALAQPDRVAGLALFGTAGGLATPQLRKLQAVPIFVYKSGLAADGSGELDLLRVYARHAKHVENLEILTQPTLPWAIALPLMAPKIEAFATRVTTR
jgi:pimeloyl-ACP methyl ester carboxylesterase